MMRNKPVEMEVEGLPGNAFPEIKMLT